MSSNAQHFVAAFAVTGMTLAMIASTGSIIAGVGVAAAAWVCWELFDVTNGGYR